MTSSALTGNTSGLASATSPGLVGITTQTFAGVKTFQDAPIIGNASGIAAASATVQGVVTTGTQAFAGEKTFTGGLNSIAGYAELGIGRATDGNSFIDLTSQSGVVDYNARIIRETGVNGQWQFIQAGSGVVYFTVGGSARFEINGSTVKVHSLAGAGNRAVYSDAVGQLTNSSSDQTLKTDINPIDQGLSTVMSLNPINYTWIDKDRFGAQKEIGFIAQEVLPLVPEVIGTNNDGTLSVDYPKLTAVLAKAIQELKTELDSVKSELEALKNK